MTYQNEGNPFSDRSIPWGSSQWQADRLSQPFDNNSVTRRYAEMEMAHAKRVEYTPSELYHTFRLVYENGSIRTYTFNACINVDGLINKSQRA